MIRTLLLGTVCVTGLVGCGGGAESPAAPAAQPPDAPANTVVMGDYSYTPSMLVVTAGTPITFRNDGKIEHTVADVDGKGEIRSEFIEPTPLATGQTQTVTIDEPGTYRYICTFHPTLMDGTIVVK